MDIFHTRVIAPIAISLMLSSASALASVAHAGGFHGGGQFGGGQHFGGGQQFGGGQRFGGTQNFGGVDRFAPRGGNFADHHFDFRGHDFGHFNPEERAHWAGGSWRHGWHDGRLSWWWIVDGDWYFYPEPIYPYPNYVAPYSAGGSYYCTNPLGYYPYVASCGDPWQFIPPP